MTSGISMAAAIFGKLTQATEKSTLDQAQIAARIPGMRRERLNRIINGHDAVTLDEACLWADVIGLDICAEFRTGGAA